MKQISIQIEVTLYRNEFLKYNVSLQEDVVSLMGITGSNMIFFFFNKE